MADIEDNKPKDSNNLETNPPKLEGYDLYKDRQTKLERRVVSQKQWTSLQRSRASLKKKRTSNPNKYRSKPIDPIKQESGNVSNANISNISNISSTPENPKLVNGNVSKANISSWKTTLVNSVKKTGKEALLGYGAQLAAGLVLFIGSYLYIFGRSSINKIWGEPQPKSVKSVKPINQDVGSFAPKLDIRPNW